MSEKGNPERASCPDFVELKRRYDKELTNGQRAEIRRAATPDDLDLIPAYYRVLRGIKSDGRWRRIVFFLPYAQHSDNAESMGTKLGKSKVSEMRLFQMVRSEEPNDIIGLKRILQQVEPTVNWQRFGEALFFWGKRAKRGIVEDYFMAGYKDEKLKKEAKDEQ